MAVAVQALGQVETGSRGLPAAATDPGEHGDDLEDADDFGKSESAGTERPTTSRWSDSRPRFTQMTQFRLRWGPW